jgi:hypothetical protein
MTRDEIEEWVETHVSEAIERLPDGSRSVERWVKALALNFVEIAREEAEEPVDDDEEDAVDDLDEDDDIADKDEIEAEEAG